MPDPRDELAYADLENEPGLLPPREPLRIRVSPYDTPPPVVDPGKGAFNPEGTDYDYAGAAAAGITPDATGHWATRDPNTGLILKGTGHETFGKTIAGEDAAGYEIIKRGDRYYSSPKGGWGAPDQETGRPAARLFEPDQSAAPQKPTFQPGLLSLGNVARGIGSLVQGAGQSFSAPQQPAAPPRAPVDPTAGPRAMWQQNYPSAEYSSMFQKPAEAALEASGVPAFIKSGEGYFAPETTPGEQQQRALGQVQTGANVTANLAGLGMTGASIRGGSTLGSVGGKLPEFKTVRGAEASEPGYVYHATSKENVQSIAESGKLNTHKAHQFTDQRSWPDGATEKRNYFTPTAENTWQFAPEEGSPVLLRMRQDAHPIKGERGTGDLYSTKAVPAEQLEYLGADNKWYPVKPKVDPGSGFELGAFGGSRPILRGKLGGPWEGGIRAYHSSPHDFDRFDWSKLRTGEGANTFGAGFYAAENPAVSGQGGQYWDQFMRTRFGGPEGGAAALLQRANFNRELATKVNMAEIERARAEPITNMFTAEAKQAHLEQLLGRQKVLESGQHIGPRTYEVNIAARPELLLDWDKPLKGQSQQVQEIAKQFKVPLEKQYTAPGVDPLPIPVFGKGLYESIARSRAGAWDDKAAASEILRDAGIPGIRYLDQGSRPNSGFGLQSLQGALQKAEAAGNTAEAAALRGEIGALQRPTYNYVVTDPSKLDILAKYGIVGTAGAGGIGSLVDPSRYRETQ